MPAADADGPPEVLLLAPPTLLLLLLVRTDAMEVRFPLILSFSSLQAAPDPLGFDLAGRVQAGKDSVARLVRELEGAGLLVERVRGVPALFIKVSAALRHDTNTKAHCYVVTSEYRPTCKNSLLDVNYSAETG